MFKDKNQTLDIFFSASVALMLSLLLAGCVAGVVYRERPRPAAYQAEYNIEELNQYGEWVYAEDYGNVWRPFVDADWTPFYYGHWAYTDDGWTWISYEPFGWIVYHYGNWVYTPAYGWAWIPGDGKWSPARVQWVQYGDYVCWAPLAPRAVVWPHPWERRDHDVWVVVRSSDFASENIGAHLVDPTSIQWEAHRGAGITRGPELSAIQQRSSVPVQRIRIEREKVVVGNREFHRMRMPDSEKERVEKFRPRIEKEAVKRPRQSGERR